MKNFLIGFDYIEKWLENRKASKHNSHLLKIMELSTDGSFRKCWQREDDDIYLYKCGSFGARDAGLEPYGEVMAAELAAKLSPDAVSYHLTKSHGKYEHKRSTRKSCNLLMREV